MWGWASVALTLLAAAGAAVPPPAPPRDLYDSKHGVKMGVATDRCDDGRTALAMDWAGSPVPHTCFLPYKRRLAVRYDLPPVNSCVHLASTYYPRHICMKQKIVYNETIPTYGPHRPLWAVFGEYLYVPPQRWLHNVEHGSVIMLYHPCADYEAVAELRQLVRGCIRKHVITPYPALSAARVGSSLRPDRPARTHRAPSVSSCQAAGAGGLGLPDGDGARGRGCRAPVHPPESAARARGRLPQAGPIRLQAAAAGGAAARLQHQRHGPLSDDGLSWSRLGPQAGGARSRRQDTAAMARCRATVVTVCDDPGSSD
ncbi:uncharacterized protein LOC119112195 isoform X1 [Pollicipes pollicipes]|uniref:uncharacterized protein LOC119112195 isoform X1 n=1 Tax=Pollicipes pollicipes TaxID=41117 RepID=UPI0018850F33|nr:uncharacterized protein LOC119112195 isoform X1 [Pollicipes pollicipes]XP_037092171.1 uncharacterized protein LOC119112195 isoform X1 [Pollicipes pollicipes]XP_037092172.1 uncharacterized protein LOC119112195 isoform X1 [Pollicipes pollicipes]XP_037092173.1 uncharacterized protein LOC119112195 isoform X1 [Pollicipes pollicipes]